jgi:RNA polymerase sigma-70 factor (ECF subfamily)
MHLRKRKRQLREVTETAGNAADAADPRDALESMPDATSSPEEAAMAKEQMTLALAQLDQMGDKYGKVFVLRFRDGYSETELASKLKMNVGTVKTRAYRARAAVRARLEAA